MLAMRGPSSRAKGGIARAAKLSAETRKDIARRAARVRWARWASKPMQDDALSMLRAIGLDPAVDASVRVRALAGAAELELKRRIANNANRQKSGENWTEARAPMGGARAGRLLPIAALLGSKARRRVADFTEYPASGGITPG
jgi:hypothetical protein